jgi:hypothetical protein
LFFSLFCSATFAGMSMLGEVELYYQGVKISPTQLYAFNLPQLIDGGENPTIDSHGDDTGIPGGWAVRIQTNTYIYSHRIYTNH